MASRILRVQSPTDLYAKPRVRRFFELADCVAICSALVAALSWALYGESMVLHVAGGFWVVYFLMCVIMASTLLPDYRIHTGRPVPPHLIDGTRVLAMSHYCDYEGGPICERRYYTSNGRLPTERPYWLTNVAAIEAAAIEEATDEAIALAAAAAAEAASESESASEYEVDESEPEAEPHEPVPLSALVPLPSPEQVERERARAAPAVMDGMCALLRCPVCYECTGDIVVPRCGHPICASCHAHVCARAADASPYVCVVCRQPSRGHERGPLQRVMTEMAQLYARSTEAAAAATAAAAAAAPEDT